MSVQVSPSRPAFTGSSSPNRILVVRLGAIGDVVRTLPAVRELRLQWPDAHIAWAVEPVPSQVIANHPVLDEVIVFPRSKMRISRPLRALEAWRSFARQLRAFGADVSLDFQSSAKSGWVAKASHAAVRIGFDRADARERSELFATHRVRLPESRIHRVERALTLARAAGATARDPSVRATLGRLHLSDDERRAGAALAVSLAGERPLVALAPFSSARQAWKRLPREFWVEVARRLVDSGFSVSILGGPAELSEMEKLANDSGPRVEGCGRLTLREMAALIAASRLTVSGDTGPMHMSWSLDVPVIALYGPTDPVLNAPYGSGHAVLAPRRPTGRKDADKFPGITAEKVVERALKLLESRGESRDEHEESSRR